MASVCVVEELLKDPIKKIVKIGIAFGQKHDRKFSLKDSLEQVVQVFNKIAQEVLQGSLDSLEDCKDISKKSEGSATPEEALQSSLDEMLDIHKVVDKLAICKKCE